MGKAAVKPAAYMTWLPFGTIEVKPQICASWLPMGTIGIKPQIAGAIIPDSIQRVKADISRKVKNLVSASAETQRAVMVQESQPADTMRTVRKTERIDGDTKRSVTAVQSGNADSKRRVYLLNGAVVSPKAYISWIPVGKATVKPVAYISWLPFGTIELTPKIASAWLPMGKIQVKPQIVAGLVPPHEWQVAVTADVLRKAAQSNEITADTEREVKSNHTASADTRREVYSKFIAVVVADLLRQVVKPNIITADTQRTLGGEWAVAQADTQRITGADYAVVRGAAWRAVKKTERISCDTLRIPGIGTSVLADTYLVTGNCQPTIADLARNVVKREIIKVDTSIRYPWILEYVNRSQPVRAKAKWLKATAATPITQNFRDHGIRSFSMVLGELTLSDTFQLETVQPMNIDDEVQGQIFDYHFHFLVEETSQRDLIQTVKGMYSKDALLYTAINATVSELNVSFYARQIATALGLEVNMVCDDFIPSQNFENAGMTYQDMISALFGWTSKLPQRQINVFIRGNTLNIIQRGLEKSVVDISDWPHSRPTIERKLVRSIWHSNNNEDPDNQAHNEEDDAPVPFTGTISHEDISYTYEDGYLVREKNEDGETSYSYQNEYDHKGNLTGKYVSRKETRNKDGSVNLVEYVYAATANNIYLFKERERSSEPKDTFSYINDWDSERITYHAPIGYGWYATTVYEDGERVGSSLSQGAPGGKASQYTIDQSALGLGSHYSSYYDGDGGYVPFSSLIDTEFPVLGDEYLYTLTQAIEWLNRKTQETVTMEIHANIRDGVPDVSHIVDFTERIRFDGNEYFLMSNSVELTPRTLRQSIKMTRWY